MTKGYDFTTAKVAIVTGGGSGIGRAICISLARRGVGAVVVADLDMDGAAETAKEVMSLHPSCKARPSRCDASSEASIGHLITETEATEGPVDAFFANAGIGGDFGLIDAAGPELWEKMMGVNVYQSVYAAKRLLPGLAERKGCFAVTSSAAGLMMQMGSVAYTTTKHASRALAEWISVTYGDAGLHVACLCPQAVESKMTAGGTGVAGLDGMLPANTASESLLDALADGRFLSLPHAEVAKYMQRKAADVDRWIEGMRRVQAKMLGPMLGLQSKM